MSVSMRFLNDLDIVPHVIKSSVAHFMAYVHGSVNEMSKVFTKKIIKGRSPQGKGYFRQEMKKKTTRTSWLCYVIFD